ncbi:uncharacterized protein LOC118516900 [Anopheles stephensi]|uniref:Uncharacterized protein n=1 Tax=Anopheles stephensi TaxID=30069 RepID=A0A182Y7H9_ANOST|nr:uncharacterized protein LOC118516900 [Anopheles stephensi]
MFATSSMLFCAGVTLLHLFGSALGTPVDASSVHVTVETIPDLEAFRKANPDLHTAPLTPRTEQVTEAGSTRQVITYSVGAHAAGERLVGISSDQLSWPTPQDVQLEVRYPTAGVGAVVTYVEVQVNQSSSTGRGYIVSGGVGQRNIRLVIEAYNTLFFHYQAAIYGW